MGFLDRLLGRKPADEPRTAPSPAPMPEGETGEKRETGGTAEPSPGEGEHEPPHEGEHDHEH
jgi:hypothetical protein